MSKPERNANGAGNGGVVPPEEHRFKPGVSGNPAGRPGSAGSSIREWINTMADWTVQELETVKSDPKATAAKRTAARVWLDASGDATNSAGNPIAGPEFDRIMDRTEGRAKQAVELSGEISNSYQPAPTNNVPLPATIAKRLAGDDNPN